MNLITEAENIVGKRNHLTFQVRRDLTHRLCWFLPSQENFDTLKKLTADHSVLDIGCGSGIVGKYILETARSYRGIRATVYKVDSESYVDNDLITEISNADELKIFLQNSCETVWLLSWPPYNTDMATVVFNQFIANQNANKLIYIGELDGCTGDEEFSEIMDTVYSNKHPDVRCTVHPWDSYLTIHDCCFEIIKKEKKQ